MAETWLSLKLLPFRVAEPQIWLAQAEAQFALWKIVTDNTKYFYVLSALDQATVWHMAYSLSVLYIVKRT